MKDYKKYLNPSNKIQMIEILEGDTIVNKINLTKKKISIKHYVNTYLFPVGEAENGESQFPLYYRVIFNKQSIKIKSAVNMAFSKSEFNNLTEFQINLIRYEALTLTHIVNGIYLEILNADKGDKNFEKRVSEEFDINQIFNAFDYSRYELPFVIEKRLIEEVQFYAIETGQHAEFEYLFNQMNYLNSYQLLQFLKSKNDEWNTFEQYYNPLIWFFNLYYYQFKNSSEQYKYLGATQVDFEYLNFKKLFLEYFPNEEFKNLIGQIKNLLQNPFRIK